MKKNLTIQSANKEILRRVRPIGSVKRLLTAACGYTIAENIRAPFDLPSFDNAAMDGYAVRAEDLANANGNAHSLRLKEVIGAGHAPSQKLEHGETSAVMTGGRIPLGADTVVMVENTRRTGQTVEIFPPTKKGAHIRRKGEIVQKGKVIMRKGEVVTPVHVGILATFNYGIIRVYQKPCVAIFSTGDEVVPLGSRIPNGKIVDSNRHMIMAELEKMSISPIDMGIIRDRKSEIFRALKTAASQFDVVITIGGVSMGEFDFVRKGIEKLGTIHFWKVKMKPGGPQIFGLIRGKPIFGLPGNPVSSFLVFQLFVAPALRKMGGIPDTHTRWENAVLTTSTRKTAGKARFIPMKIDSNAGQTVAHPITEVGSHDLVHWANADGYGWIPTGKGTLRSGAVIKVTRFS